MYSVNENLLLMNILFMNIVPSDVEKYRDSTVNLCISAVYRTRPTLTRTWSWSVTATVQSRQASWLHPWAVRKLKSWSEWMPHCWKSDRGCVRHPRNGLFQQTWKLTKRQQILIRFLRYSRKVGYKTDSAVPVHMCIVGFSVGICWWK